MGVGVGEYVCIVCDCDFVDCVRGEKRCYYVCLNVQRSVLSDIYLFNVICEGKCSCTITLVINCCCTQLVIYTYHH